MSFNFGVGIGAVVKDGSVPPKQEFLRTWHLAAQRLVVPANVPIVRLKDWYNRSQLLFLHRVWTPPMFDHRLGLQGWLTKTEYELSQEELRYASQLWDNCEQQARSLGWTQAANEIRTRAANAGRRAPTIFEIWEITWDNVASRLQQIGADQRTMERFAQIRQLLRKDTWHHKIFYKAPPLVPGKTAQWYCESVMETIRLGRLERVKSAWDTYLAQAAEAQANMQANVATNQDSYLPVEHPSTRTENIPFMPVDGSILAGPSETWRFERHLGEGAGGSASLWTKTAPDGTIIDRATLKEVFLNAESKWGQKQYWNGPIYNREPLEYAIARHLNALVDSRNIVRHTGYGLYEQYAMYRLYMEYCWHGDLWRVIKENMKTQTRPSTRVVWAVFEGLAATVVLMAQGGFPSVAPSEHYEMAVFHRDIKPPNVKLGDYDKAIWTSEPSSSRPEVGTPSYMAPEASRCVQGRKSVHSRQHIFTSKSEVWSLGRTIMSMMNLEQDMPYLTNVGIIPDNDCLQSTPTFSTEAVTAYPENLRNLVLECLSRQPTSRPAPFELWTAVQMEIGNLKHAQPTVAESSFLTSAESARNQMAL